MHKVDSLASCASANGFKPAFWETVVGHAGLLSRRLAGVTAEMADAGIQQVALCAVFEQVVLHRAPGHVLVDADGCRIATQFR